VHRIRHFLTESLGETVELELFAGLLTATGAALVRGGAALVRDPPVPGRLLVADLAGQPPLLVPVPATGPDAVPLADLDTGLSAVLAACARQHRATDRGRAPTVADLLADIAEASRGLVIGPGGKRLRVRSLGLHTAPRPDTGGTPDWRDAAVVLLTVGRSRLSALAPLAADTEIPPAGPGLRDVDRRALLALRDLAVARARGVSLDLPEHPDAEVAAARARLVADLEAVLDAGAEAVPRGTGLPGEESPAYLLTALLAPDRVRRSGTAPPQWHAWLDEP
jgi:hypothetical protein